MKTLKEMLLSTIVNGPEVMAEIEEARQKGTDFTLRKDAVSKKMDSIHPGKLELQVSEIIERTKEAKSIRFVSRNGCLPPFEAGQYINLFVEIDGVRTSRPYSLSSSPNERDYYEITVAGIATGFVSDYLLDRVSVGDSFEANGPAGVFRYNPVVHKKSSVFLAGGSGITPFMSMIRDTVEKKADREMHLIYGVRNCDVAIFHQELSDLAAEHKNFHYDLVVSEDDSFAGRKGFIDVNCIRELAPNYSESTFYLCGPQVMTDFCTKALDELNVPGRRIRREMFGSRQDIQNEPGWPEELTGKETFKITVGDKTIDALCSESILTSLERAGVRVNVCCRSGECSLCRVALVSGKVFMPRGVLLRLADQKFGYIHSCKAFPISDIEIRF